MVTIKDIAEKAGVSRGTVDRVLHNRGRVSKEKAEKILAIVTDMGYQPNIVGKGLSVHKKHLKMGFCYYDCDQIPFHRLVYSGAQNYKEELEQFGVEVKFFALSEIKWEDQEQSEDLEKLIREESMDGWAIIGPLAEMLEHILKKRGDGDVPIVAYNMDTSCTSKLAYVGCDYLQSGRLACGMAALMTNEMGNICILSNDYGNIPSSKLRIEGFEKEIKEKYPKMKIVDKVFIQEFLSCQEWTERIDQVLQNKKKINVLYLVNPGDYSVCKAISKIHNRKKIKIITNDLVTEEQYNMVKRGDISATICQEPEKQGSKALEILFQYLAFGICPQDTWCKTQLSLKIGQNI